MVFFSLISRSFYCSYGSHAIRGPGPTALVRLLTMMWVDLSGNILVVDSDNHRVLKFSNKGVFSFLFGSLESGDG